MKEFKNSPQLLCRKSSLLGTVHGSVRLCSAVHFYKWHINYYDSFHAARPFVASARNWCQKKETALRKDISKRSATICSSRSAHVTGGSFLVGYLMFVVRRNRSSMGFGVLNCLQNGTNNA